ALPKDAVPSYWGRRFFLHLFACRLPSLLVPHFCLKSHKAQSRFHLHNEDYLMRVLFLFLAASSFAAVGCGVNRRLDLVNEQLATANRLLEQIDNKLAVNDGRIVETQNRIAETNQNLTGMRDALHEINAKLAQTNS